MPIEAPVTITAFGSAIRELLLFSQQRFQRKSAIGWIAPKEIVRGVP
jgi:hypothetical protein